MILEFLPDGSPDCPLIRLFDFTPSEAGQLQTALTQLASGAVKRVAIHEMPGVESLGGCRLTFLSRSWDQAVIAKGDPADFECGFTPGRWEDMAYLVEPFTQCCGGFQWLAGGPGEAQILLSPSAEW
jgi:hypothetical protein